MNALRASLVASDSAHAELRRQLAELQKRVIELEQQQHQKSPHEEAHKVYYAANVQRSKTSTHCGITGHAGAAVAHPAMLATTACRVTNNWQEGGLEPVLGCCPGSRAALQQLRMRAEIDAPCDVDHLVLSSCSPPAKASCQCATTLDMLCSAAQVGNLSSSSWQTMEPSRLGASPRAQASCSQTSVNRPPAEVSDRRKRCTQEEKDSARPAVSKNRKVVAKEIKSCSDDNVNINCSSEARGCVGEEGMGAAGSLFRIRQQSAVRG